MSELPDHQSLRDAVSIYVDVLCDVGVRQVNHDLHGGEVLDVVVVGVSEGGTGEGAPHRTSASSATMVSTVEMKPPTPRRIVFSHFTIWSWKQAGKAGKEDV